MSAAARPPQDTPSTGSHRYGGTGTTTVGGPGSSGRIDGGASLAAALPPRPAPAPSPAPPRAALPLGWIVTGLAASATALAFLSFRVLAPERLTGLGTADPSSIMAPDELTRLDDLLISSARESVLKADSPANRKSAIQLHGAAEEKMLRHLKGLRTPLTPGTPEAEAADLFVAAAQARIATERRAVRLVRSGRVEDARRTLIGPTYAAQQRAFDGARARYEAAIAARARRRTGGAAAAALLGGLGLAGAGTLAGARRWHSLSRRVARDLADQARYAGDVEAARADLEARLREQREDLARTREELEAQKQKGRRSDARAGRLTSAVESSNDVVMICEGGMFGQPLRVLYVNPAFERMTGYSRAELVVGTPKMLQGPSTDPATVAFLRGRLAAFEPAQVELLNYKKDGSEFWVELNVQPLYDSNNIPNGWMSIQRDITERKRAAEHIQHQATHDALTDLPNRVLYEQRLKEALAVAREKGHLVGVLFFDLDRFKQINDTLGHPSGDKLLQQVAGRLKERLGPRDTVARMGGDEFTILLPDITDPAQGEEAAQKLLDCLDAPFLIDGQELFITASIGISVAPRDGSDITTLLKNADTAMYRAKDHGRDNFRVYTRNMNETTRDRIELETHLRRALEREELFLLYQPQVSLATGLVYGVETLVRWESPALGRVSPGQFIPLAEETGLIVEIGEFILRESCKQAARWVKAGRPLRVAVNLAARQFDQPNLCDLIKSILKETKLPPEWLDIEMTERMLVQGAQTSDALNKLKALGVRLSVDDFGTGYSSLSYLRTFPLDILKVDQSFVSGLNSDDRRSEAVVRALIELGHAVNLEVIAEGVETEHQKDTLVRLGCDAMQGYLFSPATRAEEVDRLAAAAAAAAALEAERGGTPHLRLVSGG